MQRKTEIKDQRAESGRSSSYVLKIGAIFLLLLLGILVAACGSSGTQVTTANEPTPVATIHLGNTDLSPTPGLSPDWCGIWVTNSSPPISLGTINIYAKFVQNKDGNPVGIAGAPVSIHIQWGDGTPDDRSANTSSTGLAIFTVSMMGHSGALNKLSLITGTFTSGSATCSVDNSRPASFVLVAGGAGSPVATKTSNQPTGGNGGIPGFPGFPTGTPKKR